MKEKYGHDGYAKVWVRDIEFENFKEEVSYLLKNKEKFRKRYLEVNKLEIKK